MSVTGIPTIINSNRFTVREKIDAGTKVKIKLNTFQQAKYHFLKHTVGKGVARKYRDSFKPLPRLRSSNLDRPSLQSLRDGPVIVVGLMSSGVGLGVAARKLVASLRSAQIEPAIYDLTREFNERQSEPEWATQLQHWPAGGTVIICLNPSEVSAVLQKLPAGILDGRWLIGYFWWELEKVPTGWIPIARQFDEVWVSSGFVYSAFADQQHDFFLSKLPMSVNLGRREPVLRTASKFVVLTASDGKSWPQRKNPDGAVQAFIKAFGNDPDVRLILKIRNEQVFSERFAHTRSLISSHQNIEIISDEITDAQFANLLDRADVFLSLSRAEGLGLIPLEAMALGKVVMATDWGGAEQYLDWSSSIPIGYKLRPVLPGEYACVEPNSRWAEPDTDEAAFWLRRLRDDPELCLRLGIDARRKIASQYSTSHNRHIIDALIDRPRMRRLTDPI